MLGGQDEICWSLNSRSKGLENHFLWNLWTYVFVLSTRVDWRHCAYILFTQSEQGLHHSTPRKFLEYYNQEFDLHLYDLKIASDLNFDAACFLNKTRYFLCRINAFEVLLKPTSSTVDLGLRVVNDLKIASDSVLAWALRKEGLWITHRCSKLQELQNCSPALTLILLPVKIQDDCGALNNSELLTCSKLQGTRWSIEN